VKLGNIHIKHTQTHISFVHFVQCIVLRDAQVRECSRTWLLPVPYLDKLQTMWRNICLLQGRVRGEAFLRFWSMVKGPISKYHDPEVAIIHTLRRRGRGKLLGPKGGGRSHRLGSWGFELGRALKLELPFDRLGRGLRNDSQR
jgi:hypothetical protein